MTLSDFQDHTLIANILNWDFSYTCEAVGKIATDIARRAVPLLMNTP